MRVCEVSEGDERWQSASPRYRLFVFDGLGGATVLEFADATLKDVQEAGGLAARDGRLWSVAAVVDDGANGRGLLWLTGMDYRVPPSTAAERRARAEMQDRYLSARALRGQAPVLPDGRRVVRMFPDHGNPWPLWESFTDEYSRTPSELGLSPELTDALRRWYDAWEPVALDGGPGAEWLEEGRRLAGALQRELRDVAEVRPDFDDAG